MEIFKVQYREGREVENENEIETRETYLVDVYEMLKAPLSTMHACALSAILTKGTGLLKFTSSRDLHWAIVLHMHGMEGIKKK